MKYIDEKVKQIMQFRNMKSTSDEEFANFVEMVLGVVYHKGKIEGVEEAYDKVKKELKATQSL